MNPKHVWIATAVLGILMVSAGCGYLRQPMERLNVEQAPHNRTLPESYDRVMINQDTSADVLEVIDRPDWEKLAQSESVIASWGQKKNGYHMWFTAVGFDEEGTLARRKYFGIIDEKSWHMFAEDLKLWFDAQVAMPAEVIDQAYPTQNARRVAVLRALLDAFSEDMLTVSDNSQVLESSRLMMRQTFSSILWKLNQSPGMAEDLADVDEGMMFDHPTLGDGRIRMLIEGSIVTLRIKVGFKPWGFEQNLDFRNDPR